MQRWAIPFLALVAVGLTAPQATADESFRTFERLCLDTGGNAQRAVHLAETLGWGDAPVTFVSQMAEANGTIETQGRERRSAEGVFVLLTGLIPASGGPEFETDLCVVYGFGPSQVSDAIGDIERWVGLPPLHRAASGSLLWSYVIRHGEKVEADPDSIVREPLDGIVVTQAENGFQLQFMRTRLRIP